MEPIKPGGGGRGGKGQGLGWAGKGCIKLRRFIDPLAGWLLRESRYWRPSKARPLHGTRGLPSISAAKWSVGFRAMIEGECAQTGGVPTAARTRFHYTPHSTLPSLSAPLCTHGGSPHSSTQPLGRRLTQPATTRPPQPSLTSPGSPPPPSPCPVSLAKRGGPLRACFPHPKATPSVAYGRILSSHCWDLFLAQASDCVVTHLGSLSPPTRRHFTLAPSCPREYHEIWNSGDSLLSSVSLSRTQTSHKGVLSTRVKDGERDGGRAWNVAKVGLPLITKSFTFASSP